jgi:hypothetical protein
MPYSLPDGKNAESVRAALEATVQRRPAHLWESLTWDKAEGWLDTPPSSQCADHQSTVGIKCGVHLGYGSPSLTIFGFRIGRIGRLAAGWGSRIRSTPKPQPALRCRAKPG